MRNDDKKRLRRDARLLALRNGVVKNNVWIHILPQPSVPYLLPSSSGGIAHIVNRAGIAQRSLRRISSYLKSSS